MSSANDKPVPSAARSVSTFVTPIGGVITFALLASTTSGSITPIWSSASRAVLADRLRLSRRPAPTTHSRARPHLSPRHSRNRAQHHLHRAGQHRLISPCPFVPDLRPYGGQAVVQGDETELGRAE